MPETPDPAPPAPTLSNSHCLWDSHTREQHDTWCRGPRHHERCRDAACPWTVATRARAAADGGPAGAA